ncbi:MAG: DUF4249 domain-containing protein [Bacteroidales bacterium]|nr:DUF4249 domain-containing protein [Bacteroidales bacterium]
MPRIKIIIFILILLFLITSCIDPYTPQIRSSDINKYVVMGEVNSSDSLQTVNVSLTSQIGDPEYVGVTGCNVTIVDNSGHTFSLSDQGNGSYLGRIDPQYIVSGTSFKVNIRTSDGETLESDYDTVSSCPPIDTVYFKITSKYSNNQINNATRGIQLYVDLNANASESHYYKWKLTETWEYRSKWPIEWYYDGTVHHVFPPDYSKMVCWKTDIIPDVLILNTSNLTQNSYKEFPLNFVGNSSSRLEYGYSLLIVQQALSKSAYEFWDRMKLNNNSDGGLYEKQPLTVKGNIHNLNSTGKEVLGYFGASRSYSKRIFISNVDSLELNITGYCNIRILKYGIREILPFEYPVYLVGDAEKYYNLAYTSECVNCLLLGGTNIKPSFWPNKK